MSSNSTYLVCLVNIKCKELFGNSNVKQVVRYPQERVKQGYANIEDVYNGSAIKLTWNCGGLYGFNSSTNVDSSIVWPLSLPVIKKSFDEQWKPATKAGVMQVFHDSIFPGGIISLL